MTLAEIKYTRKHGINVLRSCDDISNWLSDIWMLVKVFVGGHGMNEHMPILGSKIWNYQLQANIDMIYELTGHKWERREQNKVIHYPKDQINSGDMIAIVRFDGIDNMIHFGSGSYIGHTAIILEKDG